MDYEQGLAILQQLAQGQEWATEFAVYEARLRENLRDERLYGPDAQNSSARARIVDQLNRLAYERLGRSFNDLCLGKTAASQSSLSTGAGAVTSVASSTTPISARAFISYSASDKHYLDELRTHLTPLIRSGDIAIWDVTQLTPGAKWQEEMELAIQVAKIAVLLVSPAFLASDFITDVVLPRLLGRQQEGLRICSVILKPCLFKETPLAQFQPFNSPEEPLSKMPEARRDEVWVRVARQIRQLLSG